MSGVKLSGLGGGTDNHFETGKCWDRQGQVSYPDIHWISKIANLCAAGGGKMPPTPQATIYMNVAQSELYFCQLETVSI